jgi:hypothetical protein
MADATTKALHLEAKFNGVVIASATGFVAEGQGRLWLVTNRHVVTGLHNDTNVCLDKTGRRPNSLEISFPQVGRLDIWNGVNFELGDKDGTPAWYEHPTLSSVADIIALPIGRHPSVDIPVMSLALPPRPLGLRVTGELYVVGFPVGYSAYSNGAYAIWTRGSLASEPVIDIDNMPLMLVDARTRKGQSGAPVLAYVPDGGYRIFADGGTAAGGPAIEQLVGVYSGRVHDDSDLGRVWKLRALVDLLESGTRPAAPYVEPLQVSSQ